MSNLRNIILDTLPAKPTGTSAICTALLPTVEVVSIRFSGLYLASNTIHLIFFIGITQVKTTSSVSI